MILLGVAVALGYAGLFRLASYGEANVGWRWNGALAGVTLWLGISGLLGASGIIAEFDRRPPPMLLIGVFLLGGIVLALSPVGKQIALRVSLPLLVGIQAFRFPLELLMHQAAKEEVMPPQMSFVGWNFDILSGIGALVVAVLLAAGKMPRWGVWIWNVVGFALLLGIMGISISSTPMIAAFGDDPQNLNTWVAWFPYFWLPTVLVPAALFGHITVTRRLLADGRSKSGLREGQDERSIQAGQNRPFSWKHLQIRARFPSLTMRQRNCQEGSQ